MPYVIRNPWDRPAVVGLRGTFRRWSTFDVRYGRRLGAGATSYQNRTVVRRLETMLWVATGYAGGGTYTVGVTTGLTLLGRFPTSGANALPSGSAATTESLKSAWLGQPTGVFPAYAQTLIRAIDGPGYKVVGQTSGATWGVVYTNAPASGYVANVLPFLDYWGGGTSPARGQWAESFTKTAAPRLRGYAEDAFRTYLTFWRMTWQAGPTRYPHAAGADLTPTVTGFPTGFVDGEEVRIVPT